MYWLAIPYRWPTLHHTQEVRTPYPAFDGGCYADSALSHARPQYQMHLSDLVINFLVTLQ